MKISIVPAKPEHIPHIAANVREADKQEIYDFALMQPQEALEKSLRASRVASTGMADGVPVCMFGVAGGSLLSTVGHPWMIGTHDIHKYAKQFLRRDRLIIKHMLMHFSKLENYVEESNVRAVEWLGRLGFQFDEPRPMGPFGKPFMRFYMEAS
jgi:hypothetical protein